MNKADFINAISEKTDISKKDVNIVINAFQEVVTETLKRNDNIVLTGFGKFESVKKAAREGKNPMTGEKINIAAKMAPKFRPGKALKDALN